MADMLAYVAAGLAASSAFHLLVLPLLPSGIRERASRLRMRLRRHVLPPAVCAEMVSRAAPGAPGMPAGDARRRAAECMRSAGLDVTEDGMALEAPVMVGRQALSLSVRLAPDDGGALDHAEIAVVAAGCGYRGLEVCIAEMREAQTKAKAALSEAGLAFDGTFCIVCRLGSLPQAKAMLDTIDADAMSCSTPDGHRFALYGNRIEYYDIEVHRDMMSSIKKMLVAHS